MAASAEITCNDYKDIFQELGASKEHFSYRLEKVQNLTRPHANAWHLHSKSMTYSQGYQMHDI